MINIETKQQNRPPVGGADLSCLLSCEVLRVSDLSRALDALRGLGFAVVEGDKLLAYGEDPVEPELRVATSHLASFIERASAGKSRLILAGVEGFIEEDKVRLYLAFDLENRVFELSVLEDILWIRTGDPKRPERCQLDSFAKACAAVGAVLGATEGYLGTEGPHTGDLKDLEALEINELFSATHLDALLEWYRDVYANRWG